MTDRTKLMPAKRPLWVRLFRLTIALTAVWLSVTGVGTYYLTHRRSDPFPQPPPAVQWATLEQVRLQTSDGQEIGAWLNRKGDRPTVVLFLHGISDTREFWLPQMEKMARQGHASMAISFRGHGDSTGGIEDFGYSGRMDVMSAVHYLRQQFPGRPIVIVGNSLGSAAAIFAAGTLGKDISGYLLESPYRDITTATLNRANLAPRPLNWLAYAGLSLWGRVVLPYGFSMIRPIDHVAEIPADIPVTFLAVRSDRLCMLAEVQDLYGRIQSHPHAQLVIFEKGNHGGCTRADPALYASELNELLARADGVTASCGGKAGQSCDVH